MENVLNITSRAEFRDWLIKHSAAEKECWVSVKRGRPTDEMCLWYLDAVEEALCFGWIDSIMKVIDGVVMQRFTPRKKRSLWTELNKERVRRLEKLGLMTDDGRNVLPPMGPRSFKVDPEIEEALKKARVWKKFRSFPPLYQRVRAYNISYYKNSSRKQYEDALGHLIEETKKGNLYGSWDDYGRLSDY